MHLSVVGWPGGCHRHAESEGLPGSNVLQQLVNGAEAWALTIALLGAFVGAALWAIASHAHNHHYAARGRMAALISGRLGADRRVPRPGW